MKLQISPDDPLVPASACDSTDPSPPFPIQHLPPEVLSMIFWHAIPRRSDYVEPSISSAPLLLGRVCRRWRDLADKTPELWSSISLFLFRPYAKAAQAYARWIAKSSNSPLYLKIEVLSIPADVQNVDRSGLLEQFMENIARESHRWYKADISVPSYFLDTLLQNKAPILRKLVLKDPLTSPAEGLASVPWVHAFNLSAAPALRYFVVHQPLQITPCALHPITSIDFDAFWQSQVTDILDGCPQLEDLSITFKSDFHLPPTGSWAFERLKTLRIYFHYCSPREMAAFLARIYAPALRSLTIDGYRTAHFVHIAHLLDHTGGGLKQLNLLNISLSHNELHQYLLRLRCLESLRLVDSHGFDDRCLHRLIWHPESGHSLCPELKEICVLRSDCQQLRIEFVAEVLASRGSRGTKTRRGSSDGRFLAAPIQEFRFDGSVLQHANLADRDDIKALIDRGLRLRR